jgi:iron(III) transport system ATP-binding protein
MNKGNVEQIGTPYEIYREPVRRFAAGFVGTMNFLPARIEGGRLTVGSQTIPFAEERGESAIEIAFRPENVILTNQPVDGEVLALRAEVRKVTFLGREAHYMLTTPAGEIVAQVADPSADFIAMEGRPVEVRIPLSKIVLFDRSGDLVRTGRFQ